MPVRLSIDFTIVSHLIHTSTPSSTRWANNGTTVTSYLRNVKIKAIGSISHNLRVTPVVTSIISTFMMGSFFGTIESSSRFWFSIIILVVMATIILFWLIAIESFYYNGVIDWHYFSVVF